MGRQALITHVQTVSKEFAKREWATKYSVKQLKDGHATYQHYLAQSSVRSLREYPHEKRSMTFRSYDPWPSATTTPSPPLASQPSPPLPSWPQSLQNIPKPAMSSLRLLEPSLGCPTHCGNLLSSVKRCARSCSCTPRKVTDP